MREKSAYNKMMDFLARREYSEFELRQKLSTHFPEDDVTDAIDRAKQQGWLAKPEETAERVAGDLARKNKGHRYIRQFLEQKGLPEVVENPEEEIARARGLIAQKLKHDLAESPLPADLVEKAQRILFNRGFDEETITRALARS